MIEITSNYVQKPRKGVVKTKPLSKPSSPKLQRRRADGTLTKQSRGSRKKNKYIDLPEI